VVGSCEHGDELSGSVNCRETIEWLQTDGPPSFAQLHTVSLSTVGNWPLFQFLNPTDSRTLCTRDQPFSRPLVTHKTNSVALSPEANSID
jgi:hypothetical protein